MVVGANSTSTGILNLGCGEKGNNLVQNSLLVVQHGCEYRMSVEIVGLWKSSIGIQQSCRIGLGPGPSPAIQLCCATALLMVYSMLGCFVLHWFALKRHLGCFSSPGTHSGKGKCALPTQRELTHMDRNPHSWPLIDPFSCK